MKKNQDRRRKRGARSLHAVDMQRIAATAYEAGRAVARRENGCFGYDIRWKDTPEAAKQGYIEVVRVVAKELKLHIDKVERRAPSTFAPTLGSDSEKGKTQ